MAGLTKKITITSESGREYTHELPAKYEVCDDCEGVGTTLNENIRQHAYSAEEFQEAFDDEEREHYFKRGGMYDVPCKTCKGARVVLVPDSDAINEKRHLNKVLNIYNQQQWDAAAERREEAHIRRMENGGYDY